MPTMPANGGAKNGSTTMHTAAVTALQVSCGHTLLLLLLVLSSLLTLADCIRCQACCCTQRLLATAASCHKMGVAPTHLEAMLLCDITCLSACLPEIGRASCRERV